MGLSTSCMLCRYAARCWHVHVLERPSHPRLLLQNHSGGLGGGHYTAFAKNFKDGTWYNFNDSHVSKLTDTSRLVSSMAYVLFYRRVKKAAV